MKLPISILPGRRLRSRKARKRKAAKPASGLGLYKPLLEALEDRASPTGVSPVVLASFGVMVPAGASPSSAEIGCNGFGEQSTSDTSHPPAEETESQDAPSERDSEQRHASPPAQDKTDGNEIEDTNADSSYFVSSLLGLDDEFSTVLTTGIGDVLLDESAAGAAGSGAVRPRETDTNNVADFDSASIDVSVGIEETVASAPSESWSFDVAATSGADDAPASYFGTSGNEIESEGDTLTGPRRSYALSTLDSRATTNVLIEADLELTRTSDTAALVGRYSAESGERYAAQFFNFHRDPKVELWKHQQGDWMRLAGFRLRDFGFNGAIEAGRLQLEIIGDKLTVWFDDVELGTVQDLNPIINDGQSGVQSRGASISGFKDVEATVSLRDGRSLIQAGLHHSTLSYDRFGESQLRSTQFARDGAAQGDASVSDASSGQSSFTTSPGAGGEFVDAKGQPLSNVQSLHGPQRQDNGIVFPTACSALT